MNYRRFSLMVALASLIAAPAGAASVIMLQFGSFETRAEAQTRLSEIQSKHAGIIAGLEASVREVTLPPDNLTVYRTQAGPVASRASAQATCAKLAGSGDECYVVETAMVNAPSAPVTASNVTNKAEESQSAPAASSTLAQAIPMMPPAKLPPATSSASVAFTPPSAELPPAPTVSPAITPLEPIPAAPSPALQAAMDRAVEQQQSTVRDVSAMPSAAAATPRPASRSFWSRLNPFSSDDAPSVPTPPVSAVALSAAPVSALPPAPPEDMPAPMPQAPTPLVKLEKPIDKLAEMPPMPTPVAPAPMAAAAAPRMDMQLPPPPPPLMAQNIPSISALPSQSSYKVLPPAPVDARPLPPAPTVVAQAPVAFRPLPPAPMMMAPGDVKVEEAKRVPLTETLTPLPTPVPAPVSLSPSATIGEKTLWAQIGQFSDNQSALAFWDHYRQMHPDFPVVRVRTVSSLQHGSNNMVSLRVGPFARNASINSLCFSLSEQPVRCGKSLDLGVAASPYATPKGYLPGSRYQR